MRQLILMSLLGMPFLLKAQTALAIGVGDNAPCVILDNVAPNGTESTHCIRTTNAPGQYKILEFFSATCSDCAQNLPIVSGIAAQTTHTATTRLVSVDSDANLVKNYIKGNLNLIHFEVALDLQGNASMAYGVYETPTTFVLDPKNTVVFRHDGILSQQDVQQIETLVTK